MRNILLVLDGKLVVESQYDLIKLLYSYQGKLLLPDEYLKTDLLFKSMRDDWLVDISISEDGVFRVRDMATYEDWQEELRDIKIAKYRKAFGAYPGDEKDYAE